MPRKRFTLKSLQRAGLISAGVVAALCAVSNNAANAGTHISWRNHAHDWYLETLSSSTANGAVVDTWPGNGSKTQYWNDRVVDSSAEPYWQEINYNSGKALDRYNNCRVVQWDYWGGSQQQWHERKWSGGGFWLIINRAGCNGNAFTDALVGGVNSKGEQSWLTSEDTTLGGPNDYPQLFWH